MTHFVDDNLFKSCVLSGQSAEIEIIQFLAIKGHRMVVRGNGAGSAETWKDGPKRDNTPDLACEICGLIVEAKAQIDHRIAINHTETRPWNSKLRLGHWVAFVYRRAYKFYRYEDLRMWVSHAIPDKQKNGAPCLVWPSDMVPLSVAPACIPKRDVFSTRQIESEMQA